jgi:TP901 family phage tail tape measure protein
MALNSLGLGMVISAKDQASQVFGRVSGAMKSLTGAIGANQQAIGEFGSQLSRTGKSMMLMGGAGVAALGLAAKASADYGMAVAEVRTIANEAQFPLNRIKSITQEMSILYRGDMTEQAKAMYQAISSGATSASDATDLMHAANKLSIAGLDDVESSIDLLTNVINAYSMSYGEATDVSDMFFTAVRTGKTTVTELSKFLGQVAPTASNAGVRIEELNAALATITTRGVRTRQTVTGLKVALANIASPTKAANDEAKRLGVEFNATALRSKGLVQFLKEITESAEFNQDSFVKLFGSLEARNAILTVTGGNMEKLNEVMGEMEKRAGATGRAYGIISEQTGFLAEVLQSNLKVAITQVGEALEPMIRALISVATKAVVIFNKMPKSFKQVLVVVIAVGSAMLLAAGAIAVVVGAIAGLVAVGTPALIAMAGIVALFEWMSVAAGMAAFAITGFYIALKNNVGGIGRYVNDMYNTISLAFNGVQQLFEHGFLSGEILGKGNDNIRSFAISVFLWVNRIKEFFSGISTGFETAITGMGPVFEELKAALTGLAEAFGFTTDKSQAAADAAGSAFDRMGERGKTLGTALAEVFSFIVRVVTAVTQAVDGFIGGFVAGGPFLTTFTKSLDILIQAIENIMQAFGVANTTGEDTKTVWHTVGAVIGFVASLIAGLIGMIATVIAAAINIIGSAIGIIVSVFSGLVSFLSGVWNIIAGIFTLDWTRVWKGAAQVVLGIAKVIIGAVGGVVNAIAGLVDAIAVITTGKTLGAQAGFRAAQQELLQKLAEGMGIAEVPAPAAAVARQAAPAAAGMEQLIGAAVARQVAAPTAVAGMEQLIGAAVARQATPPTPAGAQPGVVAAGAGMAGMERLIAAAVTKPTAPQPVNVNLRSEMVVDGEVLASVVQRHQGSTSAREFGPTPTAT